MGALTSHILVPDMDTLYLLGVLPRGYWFHFLLNGFPSQLCVHVLLVNDAVFQMPQGKLAILVNLFIFLKSENPFTRPYDFRI